MERLRLIRDALLVSRSSLLDKDWYLEQYPDVNLRGLDPYLHYLTDGWREGRDPSPVFHTTSVFFLNKYFLGGENSVRGFDFRSIWVRDEETNRTILENGFFQGGTKFVQLNLEYQFLIGGPVRLVPFFDMGNVYADFQSVDISHMRYSAGIELRINVPLFGAPLRFIYAKNLDPIDLHGINEERFKSFDFSIGTAF